MPCDMHEQELETQSCCCIVDVRAYSAFFNINVKVTTTTDERPRAFRLGGVNCCSHESDESSECEAAKYPH